MAERDLTLAEARALDAALAERGGGLVLQDEWRIALAAAVTARQRDADLDPYDPKAVEGYVPVSRDAAGSLGMPLQADDLILRLQRLLTALPYAPGVWALPGDLAQRDGGLSEVDLALIERVEPWYLNAVVYSNYDPDRLAALVAGKYWAMIDPSNILKTRDISGLDAAARQRLDAVVHCPMLRQMTILNVVCHNHGLDLAQCGGFPSGAEPILTRLRDIVAQGSCQVGANLNRDPAALAYDPVKIDFAAAP